MSDDLGSSERRKPLVAMGAGARWHAARGPARRKAQADYRAGRFPARARHLLQRERQGAGDHDFVRAPRHRQLGAWSDQGIGYQQGARDPRRLRPDADAAGIRAQYCGRVE